MFFDQYIRKSEVNVMIYRLVVIIAVYTSHHQSFKYCEDSSALQAFYIGMMALLFSKVLINIVLIYYSSQVRPNLNLSLKLYEMELF